jgi:hypothetical protein
MWKIFLSSLLSFFIYGCTSINNFDNDVKLFDNSQKKSTFDSCANFSYISHINDNKYGNLFIEYIDLDSSCSWTGFQRGYFEYLFKTTLKLKSFKLIERKDYDNYEFSTYLVDEKYYMNLIYKYSVYENLFIVDYEGKYSTELIKIFDTNYENIYLNNSRFSSNYSKSLVNMNIINSYFSREREDFFEK